MALRAVTDHPKFAHLKSLLGMGKGATLGYLEAVWHFTARFTPRGNVGKYPDLAIETWVEWEGKPGKLIQSLVESCWLHGHSKFRVVVHDWPQHADDVVQTTLARNCESFWDGTLPRAGRLNQHEREKFRLWSATYQPEVSQTSDSLIETPALAPKPVPVPVPVPEPEKQTSPSPKPRRRPASPFTTEAERVGFDEFWGAYWLRVARTPAENAYVAALSRVDRPATRPVTHSEIMAAVVSQSPGMLSRPPDKRPQGSTWLNQSRWNDEVQQSFGHMSAAERLLASLP